MIVCHVLSKLGLVVRVGIADRLHSVTTPHTSNGTGLLSWYEFVVEKGRGAILAPLQATSKRLLTPCSELVAAGPNFILG